MTVRDLIIKRNKIIKIKLACGNGHEHHIIDRRKNLEFEWNDIEMKVRRVH